MAGFRGWVRGGAGKDGAGKDGAGKDGDALGRLLAGYPPNRPRHPGDMAALGDAQRDANLDRLLAERDARLGVVLAALARDGVDASPMLDPAGDGVAAARAVDRWLDAALPRRPMTALGDPRPNPDLAAFRASDRTGSDLFYSLLADLALLEGEAIRRRDGRFRWEVNRRKAFRDMGSFGRVCLTMPGRRGWEATVIDVPEHLFEICHCKGRPGGDDTRHFYGELLDGAIRGGFDPPS